MNRPGPNADQAAFWTEGSGLGWVARKADLDTAFDPVNAALIAAAGPLGGKSVLDIGCGSGATTLAFADHAARVTGADISAALIDAAKRAAAGRPNVAFHVADMQQATIATGSHDIAVSRFGVMFFADPVAAFANIRAQMNPGSRLAMACWGPFRDNPWFTIPRFAATDRLGRLAPFDPRAPGPFAFAEPDYPLGILRAAGWSQAAVDTQTISLTPRGDARAAANLATHIGPAQQVLREKGGRPEDALAIEAEVARALSAYEGPGGLEVPAVIHLYTATA